MSFGQGIKNMKARTNLRAAIEAGFTEVWETLELPRPTFKEPEGLTEWEKLRPRLSRPLHRGGALSQWFRWELFRRESPFHPRTRPDVGRRLRRQIEFERAAEAREPPRIADAARAERALRTLRRIEPLCGEAGRPGNLAVCLAMQVVLLAGSLGRPETADRVADSLSELTTGPSAQADGEAVRCALEQLREFLRDPFREADRPW